MDSKELGKICGSSSFFVIEKPYWQPKSMWELKSTSKFPDGFDQILTNKCVQDFNFFELHKFGGTLCVVLISE